MLLGREVGPIGFCDRAAIGGWRLGEHLHRHAVFDGRLRAAAGSRGKAQ